MRRPLRAHRSAAAVLATALLAIGVAGAVPTSAAGDTHWPMYNGSYQGQRWSDLTEINTSNAGSLKEVCSLKLNESGSFQAGPVVVDGVMYVTTPHDTYAIDAATCKTHWSYHYKPVAYESWLTNRGVALAGGKVIRGQDDGHLIALDQKTGKVVWNVAAGRGRQGEFLSSAPIAWNNTVFIGTAGSDWGVRGRVIGYDVATGKKTWTFNTIPTGNEPGAKSWGNVSSAATGGGGTWTSYTLDPATGELFVPIGNPAPDYAGAYRPGSNLYTSSVVSLDAKTGKLNWYYQVVPHDVHDYDVAAAPMLFTASDGRKLLAVGAKDGYMHIIDRSTHKQVYQVAGARIAGHDLNPTRKGIHVCPIDLGGTEWNGPALDEKNNAIVFPMDDWCGTITLGETRYIPGEFFFGGATARDPFNTARGTLTSIDKDTGKVRWQHKAPAPMLGGVTPTAGGVTFTGDMGGTFFAFDSENGKVLYSKKTQGAIAGGVVTYTTAGKQYVAATSGNISRSTWGVAGVPTVIVFGL